MVDGDFQRFQNVEAVFVLLKQKLAAPADHHQAVLRENPQSLLQRQAVRAAVHQRQDVDGKGVVHLGAFVERRQHLLRVSVLVQINNNTHTLPVGFIPHVR